LITLNLVATLNSDKHKIFVSHSSKDTTLISLIKLAFANQEIKPYFARLEMEGKNPVEKITQAINSSIGLFALITPTVVNDKHTRDWVVFELGVAKGKEIPIFCWIDESVATEKTYPKLLENITDFNKFNCLENDDRITVADSIRCKAFELLKARAKVLQIEKSEIVREEHVLKKVSVDVDKKDLGKLEVKRKVLLPDASKIASLSINNNFLNQIYKKALLLAKGRYRDAQLSSFRINVFPFCEYGSKVTIVFDFYSKFADKKATFRFSELTPTIEHSPPDEEAEDLEKIVLKVLPWKVSPNWKQFLEYAIAKIEPLSPNSKSRCHLHADAYGLLDLGKTDAYWTFMSYDGFTGKRRLLRWNGKEIDEHNIKQGY
jgi:hypothetical protein